MSEGLIPLGVLVTTHGIDGWLKLQPYNPQTTTFHSTLEIFLEKGECCSRQQIENVRLYKGHLFIKLRGIDTIDQAEGWVGATLSVPETTLPPLSPGEYYYYQAIGLDVFDRQGVWIGTVTRVWSKAGGDLYVVQGAGKEYLIPTTKEVVEKVDLPGRKIIINPPEGLLDL